MEKPTSTLGEVGRPRPVVLRPVVLTHAGQGAPTHPTGTTENRDD
jgi:hypothetical protein